MTENELKSFIDVVISYFTHVTHEPATMGLPFAKRDEQPVVLEYTGLIGISGPRKGGIYLTTGAGLLSKLTSVILDTPDPDEETLLDMVGELTNTIAGNVRKSFGPDFMISVPMVITGKPHDIHVKLKPPVFVIPINWRHEKAYLVVGLE